MRKNLWQILALCLGITFLASVAFAKVWLLPDYQQRQFYSHRVNGGDSSTPSERPQGVDCHTYGLIPASEIGEGMSCSSQTKIMNVTCYGNCTCAPAYNKTESSCRLEGKIPGGSACMGEYYTECLCDTSLYPYTSSSCVYNLSGASCSDKNGQHYAECIDPCEGLVDNTTDLGCEKYYAACPSKCEVGKTCVANDCSAYTLTSCPSGSACESCTPGCGDDVKRYKCTPVDCSGYTLASCPSGSTCESCTPGCGDNTTKYKCIPANCSGYTLSSCPAGAVCGSCTPGCGNNTTKYKEFKGLAFQVDSPAGGSITLSITTTSTYGSYYVDWGDGKVELRRKSHTYENPGQYNIDVYGEIKKFSIYHGGLTVRPTKLYSLNLPSLQELSFEAGYATLEGTIPPLPENLINGSSLFTGCSRLTGSIPELPASLTNGYNMFKGCLGLKGSVPQLPSGLKEANSMFYNCDGLTGPIPELPSGLVDGTSMFYDCDGLTGSVPELPVSLASGYEMFRGCNNLTGSIPKLPDSLVNGYGMFNLCTGLTGSIPELPNGLTDGRYMFSGCRKLTGGIPRLPDSLESGGSMFANCDGLTGQTPPRPPNLTNYTKMFGWTQITNDGSWPSGAW